jgi:N4-gp56 family major capsid protein
MALIGQASIPEEFYTLTSAHLLVQPDPQYFHAMLFKQALGAAMNIQSGGPMGLQVGNRPISGQGAAYTDANHDRLMLAPPDPVYSSAIMLATDFNTRVGHTIRINRPKFGSGGFTLALREVSSGQQISTTAIDLSSEQVTLTLKRYAGPYDTVAAAVAPYAVDRLDASRAVHNMSEMVGKHMQRDLDKWLDSVLVTLLNSGSTTLYPAGFAAANDSTVQGDMPGDVDLLFRAEETLKLASIPRFSNGRYMAVVSPTFSRQLKGDPQFARFAKYFPQTNPLFNSYCGTVGGLDIFESTTLTATANSSSVNVYSSQVFGPGMLGAGIGRLPEVMPNTQDNYGEQALLVWIAYLAFGVLDNRMGIVLKTS